MDRILDMEHYLDDVQFFEISVHTPGERKIGYRLADPTEFDLDRAWESIKDELGKMGYL